MKKREVDIPTSYSQSRCTWSMPRDGFCATDPRSFRPPVPTLLFLPDLVTSSRVLITIYIYEILSLCRGPT